MEIGKLSEEAKVIKSGTYRHFKGDLCNVIGVAQHSETGEEFVIYEHDSGKEKKLWIRPLEMFIQVIDRDGYLGSRFNYVINDTSYAQKNQVN